MKTEDKKDDKHPSDRAILINPFELIDDEFLNNEGKKFKLFKGYEARMKDYEVKHVEMVKENKNTQPKTEIHNNNNINNQPKNTCCIII